MFQINPCLFSFTNKTGKIIHYYSSVVINLQVFCLVNRPELPVIITFNFEQSRNSLNKFTYSFQVFNIPALLLNSSLIKLYVIMLYINHMTIILMAKFRCNLWSSNIFYFEWRWMLLCPHLTFCLKN